MKGFIVMSASMTNENNFNFVCVMCDEENLTGNGSIKNNKFICMDCVDSLNPTKATVVSSADVKKVHFSASTKASSAIVAVPAPTMCVGPDPKPEDVPRYSPNPDGTCTCCKKNFGYCRDSVIKNGIWFCGKTCSRIYSIELNPLPQQTNMWPFQSSLQTVRPISVGHGFMMF